MLYEAAWNNLVFIYCAIDHPLDEVILSSLGRSYVVLLS